MRRGLPLVALVQAALAVVSVLVMVVVALRIGPMLEEKQRLEEEIGELRQHVEVLEARLRETADLSRFTFPIDLLDVKALASRHPGPARALQLILELRERDVGWRLGGRDPEQGFDSPSFAAFVLEELGALEEGIAPGDTLLATSRKLFERLPPASDAAVGDLVFYPTGYVLFSFVDDEDRPYVVGMTPMGIVALRPDFAEPVGVRRSGLAD